jgi:hypothetical protein
MVFRLLVALICAIAMLAAIFVIGLVGYMLFIINKYFLIILLIIAWVICYAIGM